MLFPQSTLEYESMRKRNKGDDGECLMRDKYKSKDITAAGSLSVPGGLQETMSKDARVYTDISVTTL